MIFGADPTHDLAALDTILAVARDGRLYSREDLTERLARYQAHYEGPGFSNGVMPIVRGVLSALTGILRRDS